MSTFDVKIKKASADDLDAIVALNLALFHHDAPFDPTLNIGFPESPLGEDYFRSRITGEDSIALIATREDEPIGYLVGAVNAAEAYRLCGPIGELENMLVASQFRNHGIGSKLIEQFLEWCKKKNLKRAKILAYVGNVEAIEFYERSGFKKLSVSLEREL